MANLNTIHWRYIAPSFGGTYTIRSIQESDKQIFDPNAISTIGTADCQTCVGVYFKLTDTECFMAHINSARMSLGLEDVTPDGRRVVNAAQGAYVRGETIRRLEEESKRAKWPAIDQIGQVVMTCPLLEYSDLPLTGRYIIDGIRDFLGRPDLPVNTDAEGFLVKHATGEVTFLTVEEIDSNDSEESVYFDELPLFDNNVDYVAHEQPGASDPLQWFIDVDRIPCVSPKYHRRRGSDPEAFLQYNGNSDGEGTKFARRRRHSAPPCEALEIPWNFTDQDHPLAYYDKPPPQASSPTTPSPALHHSPPAATKASKTSTTPSAPGDQENSTGAEPIKRRFRAAPHRGGRTMDSATGKVYPEVMQYRIENGLCRFGGQECAHYAPHSIEECPLLARPTGRLRVRGRGGRGNGSIRRFSEIRGRSWR